MTILLRNDPEVRAIFEPKEDLTAYELAKLLPWLMSLQHIRESDFATMGTESRHLFRVDSNTTTP